MSSSAFRDLDAVLNEATLLRLDVDREDARVELTFHAWALLWNQCGVPDARMRVSLRSVQRIVVCAEEPGYRGGHVLAVSPSDLQDAVRFRGESQYGWSFIDPDPDWFAKNHAVQSLDLKLRTSEARHRMCTFKESCSRSVALCIWFDTLQLLSSNGDELVLEEVVRAANTHWASFFAGGREGGTAVSIPDEWF